MANSYRRTITLGLDYSEFTGGIDECNQKMKEMDAEFKRSKAEMEGNATASQKAANKAEYLSDKMEVQKRKVELARQKYEELKNSQADTSAIERARMALTREETTLANLNNEYNATILAQSNFKQNAMAMVAILASLAAGLLECANSAAEYSDNISTLSEQTGVSVQTLQEWSYASGLMDTSLETITGSFSKLERAMANNNDAFSQLGVSITDSSGNMRNAEAVFYEVIDALGQIENKTERDQIAMQIFGRSAQELTGIINTGSAGLKAYAAEAHELGRIMSDEEIQSTNEWADATDRLRSTWESVKNQIGASIAPLLTAIADALNSIPTDILAAVAAVVTLTTAVGAIVLVVNSLKIAYAALLPAMKAVTAEMMAQGGYVTLIVGMILALVAAVQALNQELDRTKNLLKDNGFKTDFKSMMSYYFKHEAIREDGSVFKFASGGVSPGGMAWVGEHGPELVNLPAGATVYNNRDSRKMSGNTYNINMNCDLSKMRSVSDVVDAISGLNHSVAAGGY